MPALQEHPQRRSLPPATLAPSRQSLCYCRDAVSARTVAGPPGEWLQPAPQVDSRKPSRCRVWYHRVRHPGAQLQGWGVWSPWACPRKVASRSPDVSLGFQSVSVSGGVRAQQLLGS